VFCLHGEIGIRLFQVPPLYNCGIQSCFLGLRNSVSSSYGTSRTAFKISKVLRTALLEGVLGPKP
jgi:hypothetical protein